MEWENELRALHAEIAEAWEDGCNCVYCALYDLCQRDVIDRLEFDQHVNVIARTLGPKHGGMGTLELALAGEGGTVRRFEYTPASRRGPRNGSGPAPRPSARPS